MSCSTASKTSESIDCIANTVSRSGDSTTSNAQRTSIESISKHRDDYTDGHKQSGVVELFWSAIVDGKHIILVSPVSDTSSYAVTGVIPRFNTSNPTPVYLQAGSIKVDQLGQPMILLSHGALINRHISKQLQHFAQILLTDRVAHGDLMNQCLIQASPGSRFSQIQVILML